MKYFIVIIIIFFSTISLYPQKFKNTKLQEREKQRIINLLELDDETSKKFFNQRDLHRQKMIQFNNEFDVVSDKLDSLLKAFAKDNEIKKYINQYNQIDKKILNERDNFYKFMNSTLNPKQVAKYLLFERKFRKGVKEALRKERKEDRPHRR